MSTELSNPVNKLEPNPQELAALIILEVMIDGIRFRVDGIRPDLLRERPAGFDRSMTDVITELRHSEQDFATLIRRAIKEKSPSIDTGLRVSPRGFVADPFTEVGAFLQTREDVLAFLRRLSEQEWKRTINDPARGAVTLQELATERAANDEAVLELLKQMRVALLTTSRAGSRTMYGNRLPDSTA